MNQRRATPARRAAQRETAKDMATMGAILAAAACGGYYIFVAFLSGHLGAMAAVSLGLMSVAGMAATPTITRLESRERTWHGRDEAFRAENTALEKLYRKNHNCPHCRKAIGIDAIV